MFFESLYRIVFPSGIIFHLPEDYSLYVLPDDLMDIFSFYMYVKELYVPPAF